MHMYVSKIYIEIRLLKFLSIDWVFMQLSIYSKNKDYWFPTKLIYKHIYYLYI